MISVEVPEFKDVTNSNGETVTYYVISVTNGTIIHKINKRYSEFADLYKEFQNLPELSFYRFPNKSLFNNSANFTKERRVEGFNELMNILIRLTPISNEVLKFIALDLKKNDATAARNIKYDPKKFQETIGKAKYEKRHSIVKFQYKKNIVNEDMKSTNNDFKEQENSDEIDYFELEDKIKQYVVKNFKNLFIQNFMYVSPIYLCLIIINFIDISNSTYLQLVMTVVALVSTVSFIRIIKFKSIARRKKQVDSCF
jgi:hypothetical protein